MKTDVYFLLCCWMIIEASTGIAARCLFEGELHSLMNSNASRVLFMNSMFWTGIALVIPKSKTTYKDFTVNMAGN